MHSRDNPLAGDLDHILQHTKGLWDELRGKRIFITGGTGFIGCWLLESLLWINDQLKLSLKATVLTRNPDTFVAKAPHITANPAVQIWKGDVRSFTFPEGEFSYIIHAATESDAVSNRDRPLEMLQTIVKGTERTLEFAVHCKARKFLYLSSGAVYGQQPPDISQISEEYKGAPDPMDPLTAYHNGKRMAEHLCFQYGREFSLPVTIARCFAFVGPYLPLDRHFAIGNFIRDGLMGGPIIVKGDGSPYRSYLYAADLAIWLWTIMLKGQPFRPYNVGSEKAYSIVEIAQLVASAFVPPLPVQILERPVSGRLAERYVPSTQRAETELYLRQTIDLPTAIDTTIRWHQRTFGKSPC